ncbi:ribosome biogenesis protein NOP53 [Cuculus canorus]|uniref:ribosome biogenesis protein NOP53 n=1 Tax=Cuculus canorus TaxID=55661 RepID=UPI0023AA4D10|nr:ribosome biogenesis protein NOP53 [Cuculus canorus]
MAAAVSSAPFLALGPSCRDPRAPPRRRNRGPRNRKKGWKRWAGPEARLGREIGDFLEDVGLQQRATGGLIAEQPDEGLFFVDTGNDEKDRKQNKGREKPLRVDLILQPDSKVPAPKDILAHQIPNARKEKRRQEFWEKKAEKGILPRCERRLQARLRRGAIPKEKKPLEKGRSDPERSFYDIWAAENPLERALEGQDEWFLQQTKKRRVKRPARLGMKPSDAPAVEVIAPGGSYNPTFEDHQALLLRAHEVELRKKKEEDKVEKQLRIPSGTELPTEESLLLEQCQGLIPESDDDEDEEPEPTPTEPDAIRITAPRREKKTEQQRRREKEARELATRQRLARLARCRRQELFRLRALRLQVSQWEAELRRRRQARLAKRRAKDALPRRLGSLRYEDPALDVQLSDELADSLRTLKPEGSVLRDRFKSFQRRNLIEPRQRAKFKRRYRVKYVEKRAFREVTL